MFLLTSFLIFLTFKNEKSQFTCISYFGIRQGRRRRTSVVYHSNFNFLNTHKNHLHHIASHNNKKKYKKKTKLNNSGSVVLVDDLNKYASVISALHRLTHKETYSNGTSHTVKQSIVRCASSILLRIDNSSFKSKQQHEKKTQNTGCVRKK